MAYQCDCCHHNFTDKGRKTPTGRELCGQCHDDLVGVSARLLAGGGIPGAVATTAWFTRGRDTLRRRLRRKPTTGTKDAS